MFVMLNDSDTLRENFTDFRWSVFDDVQVCPALPGEQELPRIRLGETIAGTPWVVNGSLGRGGVGEVFAVEHELLGRKAAFKVLHPHNLLRRGLAERMKMEGQWLGMMRHTNIVEALDMGILGDGRPYLVLELLEGCDLRASLQRIGVFSIPSALDMILHVLRGLSALHQANIGHRDIKLENLFHCSDGNVVILDLGAAALLGEESMERPPSLGTPRTMAPEQYADQNVDGRADLYALGLVLYELLTGRGPFDDVSGLEALRYAHCHRKPAPPSELAPQFIPPEIDALVLRALAKSPEDRFASAEHMAAEIQALRDASSTSLEQRPATPLAQKKETWGKVTATSVWLSQTMSSPFRSDWRRPFFVTSKWAGPIAFLALLIATLALGIAVGKRLPRIDVAVHYGS
jgi:eukaryotic-like serine/threonine-protein kinase